MRRAPLLALIVLAACGGKREAPPPDPAGPDRRAGTDAKAGPRPHAFVVGTVVIAARSGEQIRPLRLDPATGAWTPLGSGHDNLYPTEVADGDAVLAISARGEDAHDHVEQLAWVRGAAVERLGPQAGAIRYPARAPSGALIYESSAHSFRDLYRLDGAGEARLTDDRAGNLEPALSPDGATVVFTSSRDGDAELYRMPAAGGRATRLTASARDDWGARWSPHGHRLAFVSDREGPPRVFVMDADGTQLSRLTRETDTLAAEDAPRWSPDGRTIALLRNRSGIVTIVLVDVDAWAARVLTPAGASDEELAWSPDGAYLLVARHQPPPADAAVTFVRIADGAVVATDPIDPLALRWFPPPITASRTAPSPGD